MAGGYARIPHHVTEAWAASRVSGRAWRTLMVLLQHMDRNGMAWPGPARIGRIAKIDPADARDALSDLVKAGMIARAGTVPTPNGPANRWQIVGLGRDTGSSDIQVEITPGTQGENAPRVKSPTPGDTQGDTQGVTQGENTPLTNGNHNETKHSIQAQARLSRMLPPLRSVENALSLQKRANAVPDRLTRRQGKQWIANGLANLSPGFKVSKKMECQFGAALGVDEAKIATRVRVALEAMASEANRASNEPIYSPAAWVTEIIAKADRRLLIGCAK